MDHHPSGKVYRARRDDSPKECEEKGSQKVVVVGEVLWVFPFFFSFFPISLLHEQPQTQDMYRGHRSEREGRGGRRERQGNGGR